MVGIEWKTSENEYTDSECPFLGNVVTGSLENCKNLCLETQNCNAFNYESSSTGCVTRKCSSPAPPPAQDSHPAQGFWLDEAGG